MRFVTGHKPGVGGVMKAVFDPSLDPMALDPVADANKFIFDSEKSRISYIYDIDAIPWDMGSGYSPGSVGSIASWVTPSPPGVNYAVEAHRMSSSVTNRIYWQETSRLGIDYPAMVETRRVPPSGEMPLAGGSYELMGEYQFDSRRIWWLSSGAISSMGAQPQTFAGYSAYFGSVGGYLTSNTPAAGTYFLSAIWDLPSDTTPLPTDGVSGGSLLPEIIISQSQVKIARPGYDISDPVLSHAVLDSRRIPAKLIAYGVTTLPSNKAPVVVPINTPFNLSPNTYLDAHLGRPSWEYITHPPIVIEDGYTVTYQIDPIAKTVTFKNTLGTSTRLIWMILGDDNSEPTTGGEKVFYQGEDEDGKEFVQIKLPGSSDTAPALNDIMFDTRLPVLRIAKEGWIPVGDFTNSSSGELAFGEKYHDIEFENDGSWTPMVKYMVNWGNGYQDSPIIRRFQATGPASVYNNRHSCVSSMCRLYANKCRFYLNPGMPVGLTYDYNSGAVITNNYNNIPTRRLYSTPPPADLNPALLGIRYYILALPTPHPF